MELKQLTEAQKQMLDRPLPAEAVTQHPTKSYLSSIKSIYVTERFNEVFGVGRWLIKTTFIEKVGKMVVIKVNFSVPEYGIEYECYGGNDNTDLGDAYKGATTDAITKIGSWLGVGADVFKGLVKPTQAAQAAQAPKATEKKIIKTLGDIECQSAELQKQLFDWCWKLYEKHPHKEEFNFLATVEKYYAIPSEDNRLLLSKAWAQYSHNKKNAQ